MSKCLSILFIFMFISLVRNNEMKEFKIGGLFETPTEEIAFRLSSNLLNEKYPDLPFRLITETRLNPHQNTLQVYQNGCLLLQEGIIGIFGPNSHVSSPYIQALYDRKEIPHIESHRNLKPKRSDWLVNLFPHPPLINKIFADILAQWRWKNIFLIYDDVQSLLRSGDLLRSNSKDGQNIILKQLEKDDISNYRLMLTDLKRTEIKHFILECSIDILEEVLNEAQEVGLMTENYNYLITNFDLQTVNLERFYYSGVNITGIRIIDPENQKVETVSKTIQDIAIETNKDSISSSYGLKYNVALIMDGVELFAETLKDLVPDLEMEYSSEVMDCKSVHNWKSGYTIINRMKGKTINGLTGTVKFNMEGFRTDFSVDVIELGRQGLEKIGVWNSTNGLEIRRKPKILKSDKNLLFDKDFKIIIALTPPYAMYKESTAPLDGNDRFEGFGIDVIEELSKIIGFNYTFIIQEDGANGNFDPKTRQWNGMIREVMDGNADFAIADLTITSEREAAVDFTMPFMYIGISILYKKPKPAPPSLFMFTSPFSLSVWMLLGVAYFLVSLSFFVMGRLSTSEWVNPYPCIEEPEYLINQFSIRNCFWFTIGSLMCQGSEIAPAGISTRTAAGVWWFFILILCNSYTANLSAFLTVETPVTSFSNLQELTEQKEIKYGAKQGGATANYFQHSNETIHRKVWRFMVRNPKVMTKDNAEGVKKVVDENYAFLMESSSIEFEVERQCSLGRVGGLLDEKGYAIAMKKNSSYRNALSTAVLQLQERGVLAELKVKWWKEKRGGGKCLKEAEKSEVKPLNLQNVGGVFLVLCIGTILGFMGSALELFIRIYRKSQKSHLSFKQEFKNEMKFFIKLRHNIKTVRSEFNLTETTEN